MAKTYCPECGFVVSVSNHEIGMQIRCPGCNVGLEIVSVDPLDVYFTFDVFWRDDDCAGWDEDWSVGIRDNGRIH